MRKHILLISLWIGLSQLAFAQSATVLPNTSDFLNDSQNELAYAVRGIMMSTSPGLYAAAVRGENKGTNDKGIGVWGSHDGTGWGVYGSSAIGTGIVGRSVAGTGLNTTSISGTALTAQSSEGIVAEFINENVANNKNVVKISATGHGTGLDISVSNVGSESKALNINHNGIGMAMTVESKGIAIYSKSTSMIGAALLGDNDTGISILGRNASTGTTAAVVGQNNSSGVGVRGYSNGSGIGVLGQGGVGNSTGIAGKFENVNAANISNALEAVTNGTGAAAYIQNTNAAGNGPGLIVGKTKSYNNVFTNTPNADLEVRHNLESSLGMSGLRIMNTGPNLSNWTFYAVNNSGDLILYAKGATRGTFNGTTGAYTAISDKRLKTNISEYPASLANVMKMEVKSYQRLNSDKTEIGLMAQDALKVFPEIVYDNTNDKGEQFYTMDYSRIGVIAIKAIQEQQSLIDRQEQTIQQQQKTIDQQQQSMQQQQKQLQKHEAAIEMLTGKLNALAKK